MWKTLVLEHLGEGGDDDPSIRLQDQHVAPGPSHFHIYNPLKMSVLKAREHQVGHWRLITASW